MLQTEIVLAVAYTVFAHLATRDPRFGVVALVDLVLLILLAPLVRRRAWAWVALPAALLGVFALYRAGQTAIPLLLVPMAFIALIGFWFGRSLRPGRVPLITKIVAALDREPPERLPVDLRDYTRRLTAAWAGLLGSLALLNLLLALIAVPDGLLARFGVTAPLSITRTQWSWFANLCNYGIVGGFFLVEYQFRKRHFPGRYKNILEFGRRMAALGPKFWRDFLR